MAVLQKIRNKAGILIAIIVGLALIFFILDPQIIDAISFKAQMKSELGGVNKRIIKPEEFDNLVNLRSEVFGANTNELRMQIREGVWQELLRQAMLEEDYRALGIDYISEDEMNELTTGKDPHPFIRNQISSLNGGRWDKTILMSIIEQADSDPLRGMFWRYMQNQLHTLRKDEKYNTLISKSMLTTNLEARQYQEDMSKRVDFDYVLKRYGSLTDSVSVSEAEIAEYYKEHKNEFKQKESRDIEYVIFKLEPSPADTRKVAHDISNIKKEFVDADSATAMRMIRLHSSDLYEDVYYKDGDLSSLINDTLFSTNDTGFVVGPYFEDEAYKLSKLLKITMASDSARARHILIIPKANTQEAVNAARIKIDSIKTAIENGADFGMMAAQHSEDQSNANMGGDLGWFGEGRMVPQFEQACFYNKKGSLVVTGTQFGFHLIEILERGKLTKRVKVGTIVKDVNPSRATSDSIFDAASDFAYNCTTIEDFRKAAEEHPALQLKTANNLTKSSSYVPDISFPKWVLGWVFSAEKGQVSESPIDAEDGNIFVVAALTEVKEEGFSSIDDAKLQIEAEIIKEKKAEQLKSEIEGQIAGLTDINDIADKLSLPVEEATGINFNSTLRTGPEPKVVAYATFLGKDQISGAIAGEAGVYIIKVKDVQVSEAGMDLEMVKQQLQSRNGYTPMSFYQGLMEEADVEDNRLYMYYTRKQ